MQEKRLAKIKNGIEVDSVKYSDVVYLRNGFCYVPVEIYPDFFKDEELYSLQVLEKDEKPLVDLKDIL